MENKIDFYQLPNVVAVVGSRRWQKDEWVKEFIRRLKPNTIVVSGGAQGVDTIAETHVRWRTDLFFKPFRVESFEWKILGKSVGFTRNEAIIRYVKRYGGIVVIFAVLDANGQLTGGSRHDEELCLELGVSIQLYTITEEENERLRVLRERRVPTPV